MPIKCWIAKYFKETRKNMVPIEISEIIKLGSDLDAYEIKLLKLIPKIEEARRGILSELVEKLEGMDTSLKEMEKKVEKMKVFTDTGDVELEMIRNIKELKDELQDIDLESTKKYRAGLEAAAAFSNFDARQIKSDEEIEEDRKNVAKTEELVNKVAPIVITHLKEHIAETEKNISARINELERKTPTNFDSILFEALRIRDLHLMGRLWYKKGEYQKALENFDEIIKLNPQNQEVLNNKGAVLGKLGQHEKEIECYEKALEIDEKYLDAWINKGITLIESGEDEKAEVCFKDAYEILQHKHERGD